MVEIESQVLSLFSDEYHALYICRPETTAVHGAFYPPRLPASIRPNISISESFEENIGHTKIKVGGKMARKSKPELFDTRRSPHQPRRNKRGGNCEKQYAVARVTQGAP
eukprot:599271-Amorphochlora_amoeboformis.AAC.1